VIAHYFGVPDEDAPLRQAVRLDDDAAVR
jgi:hypothetical protein